MATEPLNVKDIQNMVKDQAENYKVLAALETIRLNQFIPFNLHVEKRSGSDTTSQYLYLDQFDVGYVYIITSITAIDKTDAAHQILLGVKDGATHFVYESGTVAAVRDSISYVGQLMCKETDRIFAEFRSIGADDEIHLFCNGYKIRR